MNHSISRNIGLLFVVICVIINSIAPEACALNIPSFTAPTSPAQEDVNAIETFFQFRFAQLLKASHGLAPAELTLEHFSAQNLYAEGPRPGHSKRIVPTKMKKSGNSYTFAVQVSNKLYIVKITYEKGILDIISITDVFPGGLSFFPATGQQIMAISPDALALAALISQDQNFLNDTQNVSRGSAVLAQSLMDIFLRAFNSGILNDIPDIQSLFRNGDKDHASLYINDLITYDNKNTIEQVIGKIKEYHPDLQKDIAVLFSAAGKIFYSMKDDSSYGFTAIIKSEFCYSQAHLLDPGNIYYHLSWSRTLCHCNRIDEGRREISLILQRPDLGQHRKVLENNITNLANIPFNRAMEELKELNKKKDTDVFKTRFLMTKLSIENALAELSLLLRNYAVFSPRALSIKGYADILRARLLQLEFIYREKYDPSSSPSRKMQISINLVTSIVTQLNDGLNILNSAYLSLIHAPEQIQGQVQHAKRMLDDGMVDAADILDFCWDKIKENKIILQESEHFNAMEALLRRLDSGFIRDDQKLTSLINWIALQRQLSGHFFNALRSFTYSADENIDEIVFRITKSVYDDISNKTYPTFPSIASDTDRLNFAIEIADKIIESNINKYGLDIEGFTMVSVCNSFSQSEIPRSEVCQRLGISPESPKVTKLAKIARLIGKKLVEGKKDKQEAVQAKKVVKDAKAKSRKAITDSMDTSNSRSFNARIARLQYELDILSQWSDVFTVSVNIEPLFAQCRLIAEMIEEYSTKVSAALDSSSSWPEAIAEISGRYREIEEGLGGIDAQAIEKKFNQIKIFIKSRIDDLRGTLRDLRNQSSDISQELVLHQKYAMTEDRIGQMEDILLEGEGYLSRERFNELSTVIGSDIDEIAIFYEALKTYKKPLKNIDEAKAETVLFEKFFGTNAALEEYKKHLDEFRKENLITSALLLKEYNELPAGDKLMCEHLVQRTAFMRTLRLFLQEAKKRLENMPAMAESDQVVTDKLVMTNGRLFNMLKNDVTDAWSNLNIISWEASLQSLPLTQGSIDVFESSVKRKLELAINIKTLALEIFSLARIEEKARVVVTDADSETIGHETGKMVHGLNFLMESLKHAKPFSPTQKKEMDNIEKAIGAYHAKTEDLRNKFYSWWLGKMKHEIALLAATINCWLDKWIVNTASGEVIPKVEAVRLSLSEINSFIEGGVPTGEEFYTYMQRLLMGFRKAQSAFEELEKNYALDASSIFAADSTLSASAINGIIAGTSEGFCDYLAKILNVNIPEIPLKNINVQNASYTVIPIFGENGQIVDIILYLYEKAPEVSYIIPLSLKRNTENGVKYMPFDPLSDFHANFYARAFFSRTIGTFEEFIERYNRYILSPDADYAGIVLPPRHFTKLAMACLIYYEGLINISPSSVFSQNEPLKAADVIKDFCREFFTGKRLSGQDVAGFVTAIQAKAEYLENLKARLCGPSSSLNAADKEKISASIANLEIYASNALRDYKNWMVREYLAGNRQAVESLYSSAIKFMSSVSGTAISAGELDLPDIPHSMLTVPPDASSVNLFSLYPPLKDYGGVYFNTKSLYFRTVETEAGEKSKMVEGTLNTALADFWRRLGSKEDLAKALERKDAWFKFYSDTMIGLNNEDAVYITVVDKLPVNVLSCGNTIMINRDFLDFIMEAAKSDQNAYFVLAERIIHELGHVSMRQQNLEYIDEEVENIVRDVVFYKHIMSKDQYLAMNLDRVFTKTMVNTPAGPVKFSKAFYTAELFKNIQKWAGKISFGETGEIYGLDQVKAQIRLYVMDVMDRIDVIPSDAKLFPAIPASDTGALFQFLLATQSVEKLKDMDVAILDSLSSKDAGFLSKTRRIIISRSLIPNCQKELIGEINERSGRAYKYGQTKDIIEIQPLSYIQNVRSDEKTDVVILLEESEASRYQGKEARLAFGVSDQDSPVLLNGLVAAGRAVLYNDMEKLKTILRYLSKDQSISFPVDDVLIEYLKSNREEFVRALRIILPRININADEIRELNKNIVYVMQFA